MSRWAYYNDVKRLLKSAGIPLHYLRLTKGGQPEHPLYVGYSVEPKEWK